MINSKPSKVTTLQTLMQRFSARPVSLTQWLPRIELHPSTEKRTRIGTLFYYEVLGLTVALRTPQLVTHGGRIQDGCRMDAN